MNLTGLFRCSSVQFSHPVMPYCMQPHGLQHARLPCQSPTPKLAHPHVHWVSDAIQLSHPLMSPLPPAFNLHQHQGLCQWVSPSTQVAIILKLQLQHQSFQWIFRTDFLQDGLVCSPWSPRDSQKSSLTSQFKKRIHSLGLSFLYGPTLTSTHDYWKNNTFDYMHFCLQSTVSAFYRLSRFVITFIPKSRHLLISWLHSSSAVNLEPPKTNSVPITVVFLFAMK